ncbi:FitA-like ribbon-helix-helix domain-containing protein [Azohydromonas aeria]|uniref:FitA-like ribbon-helix-helix domain-containing protein n=1 Tax=Azohydromonas aeria TaxID=2590212 RepID=UPI0012F74500|nr:Arc family DNA-binding protein [Azohydromonas aeria]
MPVTLTLNNVPDAVYEQLQRSAQAHRRSLDSEAIVHLEAALRSGTLDGQSKLDRIRALRSTLIGKDFDAQDIDAFKLEGRE